MPKLVTENDLHNEDFTVENGKLRVVNSRGKYVGSFLRGFTSGTDSPNETSQRYCIVQEGWGQIHVDFKRLTKDRRRLDQYRGVDLVLRLPPNCPTPVDLIEVQLFDGGQIWIDAGSRDVKIKNEHATVGTRYIVNLSGFFNGA